MSGTATAGGASTLTTKEKVEAFDANPYKFPDWVATDKDCASWMNDSLEGISIWTFI